MKKLLIIGAAAIVALTVQVAVAVTGTSCIVSGSTERSAQVVTTKASKSGLNTFAAPEVRLDGLNLRSDDIVGMTIIIW